MNVDAEWVVRDPDARTVEQLVDDLGCARPVARILANRGLADPESCREFLSPSLDALHDPSDLPDVGAAVRRLDRAIDRDEQIVVFADRDVDGSCGCAILIELLRGRDANVGWYVPGKWDGYGLSDGAVEEVAARDADLLVTVDAGTTAIEEIEAATARGIDAIVIDHHQPDSRLPDATACVNPRRADSDYPHDGLAGGGVALKVGRALVETGSSTEREGYDRYALPLAALSTLGDYVPLNRENRAIALAGYDRLSDCGLPGLTETAAHVGVSSIRDVRWSLVPLLNAAQEDDSGDLLLKLLFARDRERIDSLLSRLVDYREERQRARAAQQEHLEACFGKQVEPGADEELVYLVETDEYVSGGVVTGLSKEVGRPVIAYRAQNGIYTGTGRSDPDVDFLALYEECAGLLEDYWGHPGAAGFRVEASNLDSFARHVDAAARERYSPEDLGPTVEIDAPVALASLNADLLDALERLRPFGPGNDEPRFLLEGVAIGDCEVFGRENQHVRLVPDDGSVSLIDWNGADRVEEFRDAEAVDVVGTLAWDGYAGQPQVNVSDYRVVTSAAEER